MNELLLHRGNDDRGDPVRGAGLFVRTEQWLRGPFVPGVLRTMQERGEIRRETLLSPDRERWVMAGSLPDLFPPELFVVMTPESDADRPWYMLREGRRSGPLTWSRLQELAMSGELRPFDLLTVEGSEGWTAARLIDGLELVAPQDPNPATRPTGVWIAGIATAVMLLIVLPAGAMLIWNELGIGREETLVDREDVQGHEGELQAADLESQEWQTRTRAEAEVLAAELESEARIQVAETNRQARTESARITADASRDAARTAADGVRDAARIEAGASIRVKKLDEGIDEEALYPIGSRVVGGRVSGTTGSYEWSGTVIDSMERSYRIRIDDCRTSRFKAGTTYDIAQAEIAGWQQE